MAKKRTILTYDGIQYPRRTAPPGSALSYGGFIRRLISKKNAFGASSAKGDAILKGFASVFDLSGRLFLEVPDLKTGFKRDRKALAGDWRRIGGDMARAIHKVAGEQ
ncbi:MAG: hypothetical protein FWC64_11815 [Treponema sp.]|nr:hypothetical protein [Treponema sp.]